MNEILPDGTLVVIPPDSVDAIIVATPATHDFLVTAAFVITFLFVCWIGSRWARKRRMNHKILEHREKRHALEAENNQP